VAIRAQKKIHSLLDRKESKIFAGYIVFRNLKRKNTDTRTLEEFLRMKFGLCPSKSWFSRFCKRNLLSYRTTACAKWSEKSKRKWNEAIDYLNYIRKDIKILKLPLNKIACFDKTKFRLFSVGTKQVGIRGGGQPRRFVSRELGHSLTVYSTLVADGTVGPLYIESNKPIPRDLNLPPQTHIEYIPRKQYRRGERGTISYLEKCFSNKTFVDRDLVLCDNESSFKTELVKDLEFNHCI